MLVTACGLVDEARWSTEPVGSARMLHARACSVGRDKAGDTAWMTRAIGVIVTLLLSLGAPPAIHGATPAGGEVDYAQRGPYAVDIREVTIPRPGTGERFGARLFLPVAVDETGSEVSPIFAFGHGYLAPIDIYQSTLEHLASWGITVVAPRSGGGLVPSHEAFGADLVAALDHVSVAASEDDWPGLPVDGTSRSVGGHSMGGGAAVLAARLDPSIRTVATLSAADTRPSAVTAAEGVEAPMLLVAASEDRITPIDRHQRPIFEAAAGPAQLRVIEGGGHCGYLDQADLIGLVCGQASLAEEEQRAEGQAALSAWLRARLMDDAAARHYVEAGGPRLAIDCKGGDAM
jgi:pimeloyl-ACP methyl ester carboxylesterase